MNYTEKYRPQFHFTPPSQWMNDPNGMVYYEGEYHLFYQYHPESTVWGPMHWGHAVSTDLTHWEHLPVALKPDHNGMIFSGSAVVDHADTSGFFGGGSGLVAIFTHADTYPGSSGQNETLALPRQRQSIAYSTDKGRTWTMFDGNPVLSDEAITDFRDPKVFWFGPDNRWVMVLAAGDHVRIYTSPNLKDWTFGSEFGKMEGSHDGVWECPDLFELPVDGNPELRKWVMIVSIGDNPERPEGSRTQYFTGTFDGTVFTSEYAPSDVIWLDWGRDNYAGVTWSDIPEADGRRLFIGWMSNWKYANHTPTSEWRSAMTIPRVLTLHEESEGLRLVQTPVAELEGLRSGGLGRRDVSVSAGSNPLGELKYDTYEIVAEFELDTAAEFGFKVQKSDKEETVIGYDAAEEVLFIDRCRSGVVGFSDSFPCKHGAPLTPRGNKVKLHAFVDWSSVEVFANDGIAAITDLIFPDPSSLGVEVYAVNGNVTLSSFTLYPLNRIHSANKEVVQHAAE